MHNSSGLYERHLQTNNPELQQIVQPRPQVESVQVVSIQQTSPLINISIPAMQPYYTNIGANEQVQYGIQYFDFPADNETFPLDAKIYIGFSFLFSSSPIVIQDAVIIDSPPNIVTGLYFQPNRALSANAFEMGLFIRDQLLATAYTYQKDELDGPTHFPNNERASLLALVANMEDFFFDAQSQKYCLVFNTAKPQVNANDFTPGLVASTYISQISISWYIDPNLSAYKQKQCAAILACNDNLAEFGTLLLPGGFRYGTTLGMGAVLPSQAFTLYNVMYARVYGDPTYATYAVDVPNYVYTFTRFSPRLYWDEFVHVRSSAQTGQWDQATGNKSDVLAILPRNRAFGELPYYNENFATGTQFFINESFNTTKNMKLTLTDADGDLLDDFSRKFTLKLAIKFL